MGKDSKQRTKGGVQPSSSSRTAELLHKTSGGGSSGGLSFLSAAAEAHGEFGESVHKLPSTVLTNLLIDDDLPAEIRMVFRKLQKKDAITKIKALAELSQLLGAPKRETNSPSSSREPSLERPILRNSEELEELSKTLLPHWIKAYQKLVLDDSRKVRETAQATLSQLCKNVGRNLGPFLKQLMPAWYFSQNDLYSPVASAGKKAFTTVFPSEAKQMEVLKFCKGEILRMILDNLQSVFQKSGKNMEQSGHKDKKQKGKKKGQQQEVVVEDVVVVETGDDASVSAVSTPVSTTSSERGDGESPALRITCASLQSLRTLIEQGLVDYDTLDEVFGVHGLFWGQSEITKELLVRRNMYDILSSLTNYLKTTTTMTAPGSSSSSSLSFIVPADKCTKFINSALSSNQKETLPNLWNTFLLLTLNGVLSDIHLARKQLLTCCKNGFYGNASQIGSSVYPLLLRIWDGLSNGDDIIKKQEFSHDLISSTIIGYGNERSLFEKASIARTLGDIVSFLTKHKNIVEMTPVYQFIFSNLSDLTPDFPKLYGTLIQDQDYYDGLIEHGFNSSRREVFNSKEFGHFIVNLCTPYDSSSNRSQKPGEFKRRVQFQDHHREDSTTLSSTSSSSSPFTCLSEQKQNFIKSVTSRCIQNQAYTTLTILSRKFKDEKIWSEINVLEIDISSSPQQDQEENDKIIRLQLYLELINVYPELPALLSKFSDEFEHFQNPSDFKIFLKEVEPYTNLQPIKRWIRMPHFTKVVEHLIMEENLEEIELGTILKFVFRRQLFPSEFVASIIQIVTERLGRDSSFSDHMSHILVSSNNFNGATDLSQIYKYYWEQYFLKSVLSSSSSTDLELIESVCFRNVEKLNPSEIAEILEKYLESCDKTKQIETLLDINKRLGFSVEMLQPYTYTQIKVRPDFLSFLGLFYSHEIISEPSSPTQNQQIDLVPKFSKIHRSAISKSIFKAKLILDSESATQNDFIIPLFNVLYAQALTKIWNLVENSSYFEPLNRELSSELDVVSSRLTERIYEDHQNAWKMLWIEIIKMESNQDVIWQCRLPLRILTDYCLKAELVMGLKKTKLEGQEETFSSQVSQVLDDFSQNSFKVKEIIPWLTEKRIKSPEEFEFDVLFKQIKNKPFVNKLLIITTLTMERVLRDDEITEEFLSLGACWVAAWIKMTKYINTNSKSQLLWVSNLAKAVKVISDKARNLGEGFCPKFVQEYVEFHSSQLYPVIYSIYVQLNEEVALGAHNFWTLQTLFYISQALVTCPSNTLAYIEPDGVKLCEIFGKILGDGVSLPSRIAAYRILKKVRYDRTGEGDLPIIPPVIGSVIRNLVEKVGRAAATEGADNNEVLVSYLLIWDALLKIQSGSNEFATYVRDQDKLLTPFLNTLFFSDYIELENAASKHFEKELELNPGSNVNLLQLACSVVQRTLRNLPYTVRWWWNNQVTRQRDRSFVEKFIMKHLSSKLAAEELGSVKLREGVDDNVTVHCHSGCNELIAHYRIEETNVTLTVSLPLNHPLGPVTVKISDKKLHGKISHLLNTRSHSLSAGLKLWKENLDGLYKDVEECAICFFILHNVTKQIPKLGCKTCKKKFHAACLYKWFSTSNKSECPLCRNLF